MNLLKSIGEFYLRNKKMNHQKVKENQSFKLNITKELKHTKPKAINSILKNLDIKSEKKSFFDRMKNLLSFILSLF